MAGISTHRLYEEGIVKEEKTNDLSATKDKGIKTTPGLMKDKVMKMEAKILTDNEKERELRCKSEAISELFRCRREINY